MKKVFFILVSVLTLVGLSCCNQAVTETSIVGRWQMISIQTGSMNAVGDATGNQVWEFTEDHKVIVTVAGESHDSGNWSLEGNQLKLDFIPIPVTVSLSSSTLILKAEAEGDGFTYTFKRLK